MKYNSINLFILKRLLVHPKRILILERKLHFLCSYWAVGGSSSAEAAASVNESALKLYVVSSIKYLPTSSCMNIAVCDSI